MATEMGQGKGGIVASCALAFSQIQLFGGVSMASQWVGFLYVYFF